MCYQASSTDIECAFSHGGLTVSKMRHSLSDKSVRAAMVIGSWAGLPEMVPHVEIVKAFNDKGKQPKDDDHAEMPVEVDEIAIE